MFRESQSNRNPIGANKKRLVANHGEEPSVKKVGAAGFEPPVVVRISWLPASV
jgi:hypothetical protein